MTAGLEVPMYAGDAELGLVLSAITIVADKLAAVFRTGAHASLLVRAAHGRVGIRARVAGADTR